MNEDLWKESDVKSESVISKPEKTDTESEKREWKLIEKLVMGLGAEQRRSRRWGIFFKSLTFLYLFALLGIFAAGEWWSDGVAKSVPHTAVIDIKGTIADGEEANADALVGALRKAFDDKGTKAVLLRINSPGGSPVQAGYVYDEIVRLKSLHADIKVYSVIADLGASGGYYIAAAADEIYADKASLVGSIGVISSSFGFVDLLKKLGVERRVLAAGEHKAFLDPFQPLNESEAVFWKGVLNTTHMQFIEQVKKGRGDRLKVEPGLFSGLIWTGEQALEMGLVDGLGSASYVAREIVGEAHMVNYTPDLSAVERLVERFATSFARTLSVELGISAAPMR